MIQPDSTDFLDAEDAAALLGVNVSTLYAYVGRKGLRSIGSAGTRKRRYWRADIERLRGGIFLIKTVGQTHKCSCRTRTTCVGRVIPTRIEFDS